MGAFKVRSAGSTCKEAFFAPPNNLELVSNSTRVGFPPHLGGGGTLLRLTGRAQRRGCPGKPIPAPAVLVSLFPSSVAISKVHCVQRASAFGCLGRRPLLAEDHGRPLAGLYRSVGPTQVGPVPIRQINNSLKNCTEKLPTTCQEKCSTFSTG